MLVLAGDIGGTLTRLVFFDSSDENLSLLVDAGFPRRDAGSLKEIVARFVADQGGAAERACFGVAASSLPSNGDA